MDDLLSLIKITETLLGKAEKNLEKIKETKTPENLDKISGLLKKSSDLKNEIRKWKSTTFQHLIRLAREIGKHWIHFDNYFF